MNLLPVARGSETIGISGKRDCGKTLFGVGLVYDKYRRGSLVFSNVSLRFPFMKVDSLADIVRIYEADPDRRKVLFFDDVDRILHARNFSFNKNLNDILMDFGKISCDIVFCSKMGPLSEGKSVDVALRDATDKWYMPQIMPRFSHPDPMVMRWMYGDDGRGGFMEFRKMNVVWVDGTLTDCGCLKPIKNLIPWCKLYNTKEKVLPLKVM
jgi:hypothetical protein